MVRHDHGGLRKLCGCPRRNWLTRNQYVRLLKKSFRWAAKKGHIARSPITDESALSRGKIAQRHRRFTPDIVNEHGRLTEPREEPRLLAAAGVRLQWLIIAALETACRLGELLALRGPTSPLSGRN